MTNKNGKQMRRTSAKQEQRTAFIKFLRMGLHDRLIPGGHTYAQILQMFDLSPAEYPQPREGVTYSWFQDVVFYFDENGILLKIEIWLKRRTKSSDSLPKAFNLTWTEYAAKLTPAAFEQLVVEEMIPCLKATHLANGVEIDEPFYCLDHLAIKARFQQTGKQHLFRLDLSLYRHMPGFVFRKLWPTEHQSDPVTFRILTAPE
jgi:hypothetical protein